MFHNSLILKAFIFLFQLNALCYQFIQYLMEEHSLLDDTLIRIKEAH